MSRRNDSFEKGELNGRPWLAQLFCHGFGREGLKAAEAGVWSIAEAFKGRPSAGITRQRAVEKLVALMDEAAKSSDGTKLRLLAYAVEQRKYSRSHDPLRTTLLMMKPPGEVLRGVRIDSPDFPPAPAADVQRMIRPAYAPGQVPTLKNIRHVALAEFGIQLPKGKPGAPKGARRKSVLRARR